MSLSVKNSQGSSPHSSTGCADSTHCTPDTHLTAFSSEERSIRSLAEKSNLKFNFDRTAFVSSTLQRATSSGVSNNASTDKDPFISSSGKTKAEQKLNAGANTFQPLHFRMHGNGIMKSPVIVQSSEPHIISKIKDLAAIAKDQGPARAKLATFSTDTNVTRALKISEFYVSAGLVDEVQAMVQVG